MTETSLKNLAGLVTGAGSGIGAAIALELAARGCRLVLADLSMESAAGVAERIRQAGGEALPVAANVADFSDMTTVADRCLEAYGRIDFAVANAGIAGVDSMVDGDTGRWRDILEVNVLGAAYTARAVLPTMRGQGSGHIILMASLSGRESYVGEPIYIASKWAVVGLGHALRKEVLRLGVRVTLVEPGLVDTPLARSNPLARGLLEEVAPLAPEDVARTVAFALSQPPNVVLSEIAIKPLRQEI